MRNAEATRERILEAAMAEFSAYGIAGARVERIAKTAGCNKNLIYVYFESKENLFSTILQKNLSRVYDDIPFTPEDLSGYAKHVFDYTMAHPDLMRLMAWFSLEKTVESPSDRKAVHGTKVEELSKAQMAGTVGSTFPSSFLLTVIMTLATAWTESNPYGPSLDPEAVKKPDELREFIAKAIELIVQANPEQQK